MTKEEMTELTKAHVMDLIDSAWRNCEYAKESVYSCIPADQADKVCNNLYEAQQLIMKALDICYPDAEKEE